MNRREFMFVSSGAAAGSLLAPGLAFPEKAEKVEKAEKLERTAHLASGLTTGAPKALRYEEIPGFLSAAQIRPHHGAHYGGALKAFVAVEDRFDESFTKGSTIDSAAFKELKHLQSSRGNSVLLHELYFDGMVPKSTAAPPGIRRAIERRFGSLEKWAADFVMSAKAAAGWAMLVVHPVNGRMYNVVSDEHAEGPLWQSAPLIVIDTYEHAFYIDYQNRKADYIEKFLDFIDWPEADRRYRRGVEA